METFWKSFTGQQRARLKRAIEVAEMDTSGEIRVHIENHCPEDPKDRAAHIFARLNMHKTELRNGILFYVSVKERQLVILGDSGIHAHVPDGFWENITGVVLNHFRENHFTEGLLEGIHMAGEKLKEKFPGMDSDRNELPDEISLGDDVSWIG